MSCQQIGMGGSSKEKKCSAIHGIENCKGVGYHCLVNTLRDEVVEVCSTPRILQGMYILSVF